MTSSTSSSRTDWKVLSSVIAVLAAVELCLYFFEDRLSLDLQHISQIPALVEELRQGDSERVLFLGNSLTRAGIHSETVADTWAQRGISNTTFRLIYPDDTTLSDWFYLFRRFVEPADVRLSLVVVSFANRHLQDAEPLNIERLGGRFGGIRFAPEVFTYDVRPLSERIRYLLSCTLRLWANRERVQTRILALIPGYEALAPVLNRAINDKEQRDPAARPPTYSRLARFIDMVRKRGTKVVFVAVPTPSRYPLPENLRRTISDGGGELLDLQGFERAGPEDFPDGYHLSRVAAARFSKALALALAENGYVPFARTARPKAISGGVGSQSR